MDLVIEKKNKINEYQKKINHLFALIEEHKKEINLLKIEIAKECNHEWVRDYSDTDFRSHYICKICETYD